MVSPSDPNLASILPYVWLAAFGLAATLALVGVACQVFRLGRMQQGGWVLWTALSWCVLALCLVALFECLDRWLAGAALLCAKTGLLGIIALGSFGFVALRTGKLSPAHLSPTHSSPTFGSWRLSWVLIAANGLAAVWASGSFYQSVSPQDLPLTLPPSADVDWVKIDGLHAYTDSGRAIALRRLEYSGDNRPNPDVVSDYFTSRLIRVANADERANCHGWVFTGGRFAVSGADVDAILADNQYEVAAEPSPGDLIVYRSPKGEILHSGIVRTAENALVLIESKWGALARYVHQPADQSYSMTYAFYHSDRSGHLLRCPSDGLAGDQSRAVKAHLPSPPRDRAVLRNAAAASPFSQPITGWLPSPRGHRS